MDCRTAQLLLILDRPHAPELSPEDRAQLGRHLVTCPTCRALEQAERAFDDRVGAAMRSVPIPAGLEQELHQQLDHQEQEQRRHWWRMAGRISAAAAGVLLMLGGLLWWSLSARVPIDPTLLHQEFLASLYTPRTAAEIEQQFHDQGVTMSAPRELRYEFLREARLVSFQGRMIPYLLFDQGVEGRAGGNYVRLYVLPVSQFDTRELIGAPPSPSGYRYRIQTRYREGQLYAYVYVHTGEHFDWLLDTF